MTTRTSSNGQAPATTDGNERVHFDAAERWLDEAERKFRNNTAEFGEIGTLLQLASVHAALATAADIDALRECIDPSGLRFRTDTKQAGR